MIRFCPNCGKEIQTEGRFCGSCGTPLISAEQTQTVQASAAPADAQPDRTVRATRTNGPEVGNDRTVRQTLWQENTPPADQTVRQQGAAAPLWHEAAPQQEQTVRQQGAAAPLWHEAAPQQEQTVRQSGQTSASYAQPAWNSGAAQEGSVYRGWVDPEPKKAQPATVKKKPIGGILAACIAGVLLLAGALVFFLLRGKTSPVSEPGSGTEAALEASDSPAQAPESEAAPETTEAAVTETPVETTTEAPQMEFVLLSGNPEESIQEQCALKSKALFREYGGNYYGAAGDQNGEWQFYTADSSFENWTKLDEGHPINIQFVGDTMYYLKTDVEPGIYRMKLDGSGKERVADADGNGELQTTERYLYFTNGNYDPENETYNPEDPANYHLYRCELDGSNLVEILPLPTYLFYVFEDGILYQNDPDGETLHLCDLNGENDRRLNNMHSLFPIYDGEYIYYTCREEDLRSGMSIWRIKTDGTGNERISDCRVGTQFMMRGEYLYFTNFEDNNALYRIRKDGTEPVRITEDNNVYYVSMVSEGFLYLKRNDEDPSLSDYIGFCRYDGSGFRNLSQG